MKLFKKLITYTAITKILVLSLICIAASSCVEPFEIETKNFESILVVNTTVTNEVKRQQVLLSRTFRSEDGGPLPERGAAIKIVDNGNTEYGFEEVSPGVYLSIQEFGATSGKEYQLDIKTQDGKTYTSDKTTLPQETVIDKIYPVRMFDNNDIEGVGILLDTFDPTGNSTYYRYEYEETYKIVASFWVPFNLEDILISSDTAMLEVTEYSPRPVEQRVCYNSRKSIETIVTNTSAFDEDRLTGFQLKFIDAEDISVAHRYSILVKQYVQSREANVFYEILDKFSESENLFSQVQPGFIAGNISSIDNADENVLGFFDVSSVSSKRIFFDRSGFISDLPRFSPGCEGIRPTIREGESIEVYNIRLLDFVNAPSLRFFEEFRNSNVSEGFISFVRRGCGDCTVFGRSAIPDFWEE